MGVPSIAELFAELRQLQQEGGVAVVAGDVHDHYEVMLFPPAPRHQVVFAQTAIGKRVPADYQEFLALSNGANLFVNESGLHGVGVASTELLMDLQDEEVEFYGAEALAGYAVFARVNGGGDFLAFQVATGRVLDGVHAEQPAEWRVIAGSFTEWLEALIRHQGAYYWLEALYESSTH